MPVISIAKMQRMLMMGFVKEYGERGITDPDEICRLIVKDLLNQDLISHDEIPKYERLVRADMEGTDNA